MMKLFFNICLLNSASFGAPRNILVSHERVRFLIQAVAKTGPGTFANYRRKEVEQGKFCQASSSLLTAESSPLPLLVNFKKIMVVGTEKTRQYLQDLTKALNNDDFRANIEEQTEVKGTIDNELDVIIAAVADQKEFHGKNTGYAAGLLGKVETDAGPKSYLLPPDFQYTSEEHTLEWKSKQTGALEGSRSHSEEGWTKIKTHHESVNTKLGDVLEALTEVKKKMDGILETHKEHLKNSIQNGADVKKVATETESTTEKIAEVEIYTQKTQTPGPNIDDFNAEGAATLGAYIIDLISHRKKDGKRLTDDKEFKAFLALKGSPAETMTRLSTTLNILYIKKKTEKSAIMTDSELVREDIVEVMIAVREKLGTVLQQMKTELEAIVSPRETAEISLAKAVYDDINRYPKIYEVKINDGDEDLYDSYKKAVTEAMNNNAIAEVHPRINLLFNVARRVHINMIGFVHALENQLGSATDDGSADPYTEILRYDWGKLKDLSQNDINKNEMELKAKIKSALTNARSASDCLLYGRYDVLMRNLKRAFFDTNSRKDQKNLDVDNATEKNWCSTTRKLGYRNLDEGLKR